MEFSPKELESFLSSAVEHVRDKIDARKAISHLTGLLFLRFVAFVQKDHAKRNPLRANHLDGFLQSIPFEIDWDEIRVSAHPEDHLANFMHAAQGNEDPQVSGLIAALSLDELLRSPDVCRQLLRIVSTVDLDGISATKVGVLADTSLTKLATSWGAQGGEFYTSPDIAALLTEVLNPEPGKTIYDPACGTAGLLLVAYRYVQEKANDQQTKIFGQDRNLHTTAIARLNALLHGVSDSTIKTSDSLMNPLADEFTQKFDLVLSNPPSGLKHSDEFLIGLKQRSADFHFGIPTRVADFNFIQRVLASLSDGGRAAMLISLRPLFIGGQEGRVRQCLIERDLVETVISLPENLLPQTSIACAVLVLNKNKTSASKNRVQFINASHEYTLENNRRVISKQNRQKVVEAVRGLQEQTSFAAYASIEEIAANKFVLLPSHYVNLDGLKIVLGEDVKWIKLNKIANVSPGTKLGKYSEGVVPLIQGRDLSVSSLGIDDLARKNIPDGLSSAVYTQTGDILIQRIGQKPRGILIEQNLDGVIVSDTVFVVRLRDADSSLARYLVEFFNSDAGQALLTSGIAGAVIPTLRVTDLRDFEVPIPNKAVIELLRDLHEVERSLLGRVDKARNIRQQLFSIDDAERFHAELQSLSQEAQVLSKSIVSSDDLNFQIRNYYPYVLAYAYRSLDAYPDASLLYKEQLRVSENLLAFLASIGLSLFAWTSGLSAEATPTLTAQMLNKCWQGGISPGDWYDIARKTATRLRGHEEFAAVANFSALWFKGRGAKESKFASLTRQLVTLKNDFKHDRGPQVEKEYVASVITLREKLQRCFQEIGFFVQHPIRLVQDSDVDWQTRRAIVNTLVYAGDHPGLRQEKVTLRNPVPKDKLYFELETETLAPIYPLISAHYCDSCKLRETYMIDLWDGPGGSIVLKSFERGHTHDNDEAAKTVGRDLEHWLKETFSESDTEILPSSTEE